MPVITKDGVPKICSGRPEGRPLMASQPLVKTVKPKAQAQRATADVIGKIQKQSLGGLFSKEGKKTRILVAGDGGGK